MNRVIGGKRYDTDKARLAGEKETGLPGDLDYYRVALYRKRTGEFFMHEEGGPKSVCAKRSGSGWSSGESIAPLSYAEARRWAEDNLTADECAELFGDPDKNAGTVIATFALSASAKARLEREAAQTGKTQSAILEELIEGM